MTDLFGIQIQANWISSQMLLVYQLNYLVSIFEFDRHIPHPLNVLRPRKSIHESINDLVVISKIILKLQSMLTNEQYWSYSETRIFVPSFIQDSRIAGLIIQFIKWRTTPARGYTTCPLVRKVRKTIALKGGWNPEKKKIISTNNLWKKSYW